MGYKNNMTEIKLGIKGKILKGQYSPRGEIMIEDDTNGSTGGYYIFTWPNDGTKWPDSNEAMVYDSWFESLDKVRQQIEYEELEIKWPSSHTKNPNKNEQRPESKAVPISSKMKVHELTAGVIFKF